MKPQQEQTQLHPAVHQLPIKQKQTQNILEKLQSLTSQMNLISRRVERISDNNTVQISSTSQHKLQNYNLNQTNPEKMQQSSQPIDRPLIQKLFFQIKQKQTRTQQQLSQINDTLLKLVDVMANKWDHSHKENGIEKNSTIKQQINQHNNMKQQEKQFLKKVNLKQQKNAKKEQKKQYTSDTDLNNYCSEYESRFKIISVQIPQQNCSKNQLLIWLGKMCKKVLSVGFNLFKNDELDINKAKVFCSENILRNLIKLPTQIKQKYWQAIDNCLKKQLIPYQRFNYPQTEEKGTSKVSQLLIQKNIFNQNGNDLCSLSKMEFKYEEDGNYNSQIMKFLNFLIKLPSLSIDLSQDIPNNPNCLGKLFKKEMQNIFEFVLEERNMLEISTFEPKKKQIVKLKNCQKFIESCFGKSSKYDNKELESVKYSAKSDIKEKEVSQFFEKKMRQQEQKVSEKGQQSKSHDKSKGKQKNIVEYREKVKSYSSQQIGQKLPENLQIFQDYEIQQGNLKLKNSAIMRVVTKWCQQLQKYFNPNQILNKQTTWIMKDGSQNYLRKNQMIALNTLLQRQHQEIKYQLQKINENKIAYQIYFSNKEVNEQLKKFSQEEAIVGQFSTSIFKLNETYLIKYLNLLIHGINQALCDFQIMQRVNTFKGEIFDEFVDEQNNLENQEILRKQFVQFESKIQALKFQDKTLSLTPQLITFKIGDILRGKFTSKEYEIIGVYKLIEYISQTKPQLLRILRVKNRLNDTNKDILINILYRNSVVTEIQLGIKSNNSKFIECSNKFNHYFYELQRAEFGPIMEMCSIWASHDQRSKFYLEKIDKHNEREFIYETKIQCCEKNQDIQFMNLPFRCQKCQYFYYDCNFYKKHQKCKNCGSTRCFLCELKSGRGPQKIQQFIRQDRQEMFKRRVKIQSQLELKQGKLLNLDSKQKKLKTFKPIIYNNQFFIFSRDNAKGQLEVIEKFKLNPKQTQSSEKEKLQNMKLGVSYKKFQISNLILDYSPANEKYNCLTKKQVQNEYFIPKYFHQIAESQKKSVAIIKKNLTPNVFNQIKDEIRSVQKINFSENNLDSINIIIDKFPKVKLAGLHTNKFQTLSQITLSKWSDTLTHLYLQQNNLHDVSSIVVLEKLIYLNLSFNKIGQIPEDLFVSLKELKYFYFKSNKIKKKKQHQLTEDEKFNYQYSLPNIDIFNKSIQQIAEMVNTNIVVKSEKLESKGKTIYSSRIKNHSKLTIFDISINFLLQMPSDFGSLINLTQLYLSYNYFTQLPKQIGNLINLRLLHITHNNLQSLPAEIGNLINLKKLNASHNWLKELPKQIEGLSLNYLNFQKNNFKTITEEIRNLPNLKKLVFIENKLKQLPKQVGDMVSLSQLNVSHNKLSDIPIQSGKFINLTKLNIAQNQISILPDEIGTLSNLTLLIISDNMLEELPRSICHLKNLTQLNISNNSVYELPYQLCNLLNLTVLNVSHNQLKELPGCFGKLINLTQLNISYNNLPQLINYLKLFKSLNKLWMQSSTKDICENIQKQFFSKQGNFLQIFAFDFLASFDNFVQIFSFVRKPRKKPLKLIQLKVFFQQNSQLYQQQFNQVVDFCKTQKIKCQIEFCQKITNAQCVKKI